jgi:tRNA isopentenyl-2-thiomethyl-A-37 hydroxylase MiaE
MDLDTKLIISDQTNEKDLVLIEKTFFECNADVGATILKLMNISYVEKPKKARTHIDEMRDILDEKDTEFQKVMESMKQKQK